MLASHVSMASELYVNHSWWCLGKYLHLCHVYTPGVAENCFPNGGGGGQDYGCV